MVFLLTLACSDTRDGAQREDVLALAVGTIAERATQVLHDRAISCDGVATPLRFTRAPLRDGDPCRPAFHPEAVVGRFTVPSQDLWSGTATVTVAPSPERVGICDDGCVGDGWTWTLAWEDATVHHGRPPDPLDCWQEAASEAACAYVWDPDDRTTSGELTGSLGVTLDADASHETIFWSTLTGTITDGVSADVDVRTVHTYDSQRHYRATSARSGRFWQGDAEITLGLEGTVDGMAVAFGSRVQE